MIAPPVDVYFKKRIDYYCRGQTFAFDVAHTLFSSHQIDEGTDLFLRTIDVVAPRTILDVGCGCGVIGIVLARLFPEARVQALDRDLLAVRYAQHNAELNGTPNVSACGSVGLERTPDEQFDLIVANIPAKIGDEAIEREFVLDPYEHLRPGGDYWFVVVSGLNRLIPGIGTRHRLKLKQVKKRAGHAVYHVHKAKDEG
ncbi:MAG: methyltransferase [Kouleothrix sp.]|nr:methyltransferase [Kouleothrix sp.]